MERYRSAQVLKSQLGRQYHIGLKPGEVAPTILFCGDPARAEKIARHFDRVRLKRGRREFLTFTGTYRGMPITSMGTGIGPDNMEIAVIELSQVLRRRPAGERPVMIRIGSCGALQKNIALGDLIVTREALRLETTTDFFVPRRVRAVADPRVTNALIHACEHERVPYHVGLTATAPGFYGAQGRKVPGFPLRHPDLPKRLSRRGVLNFEMEISILFVLARLARIHAGAVCAVYANRMADTFVNSREKEAADEHSIRVGLAACLAMRRRPDRRNG